jgi:hypothetical protein
MMKLMIEDEKPDPIPRSFGLPRWTIAARVMHAHGGSNNHGQTIPRYMGPYLSNRSVCLRLFDARRMVGVGGWEILCIAV